MTFWWCIGVVLVSGAVLAGSWCVQRFAGRFCLRWDAERREKYLNSVLWMLFSGTEECAHCPERCLRGIGALSPRILPTWWILRTGSIRRRCVGSSSVRGLMFSCCVVFAAMEVTAGLLPASAFPNARR